MGFEESCVIRAVRPRPGPSAGGLCRASAVPSRPRREAGQGLRCPSRGGANRRRRGSRAPEPRATRNAAAPRRRRGQPTCPPRSLLGRLRTGTVGRAFPGSARKGGDRRYPRAPPSTAPCRHTIYQRKQNQNRRELWVGRDLSRPPSPPACSERGHLQPDQGAHSPVQPGRERSQGRGLCLILWATCSSDSPPSW